MHISINTEEDLSQVDKKILAVLAGVSDTAPAAPSEKPAPAAAKKAAAAKPKPAPEPEDEPDEDEAEEESGEGGATVAEAKALASKMVSNGEAAKVKAALGEVGAKKVSEIPEDKVDEFIAALS